MQNQREIARQAEEYLKNKKRLVEARKLREKSQQNEEEIERERGFCQYVNGPNKDIPAEKELHKLRKYMQENVDVERKKWNPDSPEEEEEEYHNPFEIHYEPGVPQPVPRKKWEVAEEIQFEPSDSPEKLPQPPSEEDEYANEVMEEYSDSFEDEEEGEDAMKDAIIQLDN